MMTTDEIRKKFLDFFASKKHTIIESDSLVPKNDPTVLFTTAGMQQFKRQFLGYIDGDTRAASCQKCLRTDDLDKIGQTNFHHTFFEMLGNFSFGDYFKKEAIEWAWEFFTKVCKLPADKLWASVYKDDKEAEEIWKKIKGFDPKKLIKLGDHDNFWPADAKEKGPNGPCGPCSEIFFDFGVNKDCKNKKCDPSCDCGRFAEIWNLVFTQFNRKDGGILEPLPNKNIDTGMGLERLAAVLQGKKTNFENDVFAHIIKSAKKLIPNISETDARIVADHIRGIVFGINDGVMPSNEGPGYVIKKLINDITDIALKSGSSKPVIYKLVAAVVDTMKRPYPELAKKQKEIEEVVQTIEKAYIKVRQERLPEFERKAKEAKSGDELGQLRFLYRDTYGLGENTLNNATMDLPYHQEGAIKSQNLMNKQKEKSRAASKMTGDVFADAQLDLQVPKTKFLGYDHAHSTSQILKLFVDNKCVNDVKKGTRVTIILDKSPFYAESGGQVGDTGVLIKDSSRIKILDTQKIEDIYLHVGEVTEGSFEVNDQVDAEIDIERRKSIMRNHTATHLLQAALRDVLGSHVKQQGSLVAEDRLRFDFTHPKAITQEELQRIEAKVNEMILNNDTVMKEYLDIEEARNSGALAFFAEKYGKTVRVVSVGDHSKEFCGGTHLDATGQIGLLKIVGESAIAQGIRRIEAKTGLGALSFVSEEEKQLNELSKLLKASRNELMARVEQQTKRLKQLEKDTLQYRFEAIKQSLDKILKDSENVNGTALISHTFNDVEMEVLRQVSDLLKQKAKSAIIVLGAKGADGASLLVSVSDDLVKKGIKADEIIKTIAPLINGSGGGRAQMAQAGSKETANIEAALTQANKLIKERMKQ
ncbi:MAG TPA: alanine--tRNA ligase [Candidatus Omnitrophota bacterium]|nr:alanine--tRNA ligase [Candidatus Omnitrophota bacterium]